MDEKKQIKEMAEVICGSGMVDTYSRCEIIAEELYIAGYRRQSEAEWIIIDPNPQFVEGCKQIVVDCSNCTIRRTIPAANYHGYNYCPNCGAKTKGE